MVKRETYLKKRGKFFKQFPISDWKQIIEFEKIVKNYIKMSKLLNK